MVAGEVCRQVWQEMRGGGQGPDLSGSSGPLISCLLHGTLCWWIKLQ